MRRLLRVVAWWVPADGQGALRVSLRTDQPSDPVPWAMSDRQRRVTGAATFPRGRVQVERAWFAGVCCGRAAVIAPLRLSQPSGRLAGPGVLGGLEGTQEGLGVFGFVEESERGDARTVAGDVVG